ncbi:MAG: TonB C-terminal domain-containing protein [Desulfatirhabdiaceae bacterium]
MNGSGYEQISLLGRSTIHAGPIAVCLGISLLCHILIIGMMMFLPDLSFKRNHTPSVMNITMVTLTSPGSGPKAGPLAPELKQASVQKPAVQDPKPEKPEPPKPEPPKPAPPKPEPEKVQVPDPPKPAAEPEKSAPVAKPAPDAVSLAKEKPKEKTSLKKETVAPDQAIKNALAKIEKKVADAPPDALKSTIDRLRSSVEKQEAGKPTAPSSATGQIGGQGGDASTGIPGLGLQAMQAIDFYRSLIALNIEKNWFYNEQLAGGKADLVAVVIIKILSNGEIADIWFEKKSGNAFLDDSAFKAVKKSSPLPALPREYTRPFYEVGLVFTPAGLKQG